jgi:hypothetical protein
LSGRERRSKGDETRLGEEKLKQAVIELSYIIGDLTLRLGDEIGTALVQNVIDRVGKVRNGLEQKD